MRPLNPPRLSTIQEDVSIDDGTASSDEGSMSSGVSTKAPSSCVSIRPPPGLEDFADLDAQPTEPRVLEEFEEATPPRPSQGKPHARNLLERGFSDGKEGTTQSLAKHNKQCARRRYDDQLEAAYEIQAIAREQAYQQAIKFQAYHQAMKYQALQTAQWYQRVAAYHTQMALMEHLHQDEKRSCGSTRYLNARILD
jgi:hypothetical protein